MSGEVVVVMGGGAAAAAASLWRQVGVFSSAGAVAFEGSTGVLTTGKNEGTGARTRAGERAGIGGGEIEVDGIWGRDEAEVEGCWVGGEVKVVLRGV